MFKKSVLALLVLFIFVLNNLSYSQYQNIRISSQYQPNETSIMINPKNTNQVVAGANVDSPISFSGYYYSTNGGLNWNSGALSSPLAIPSGDPVIIVDTAGVFYYIQNSNFVSMIYDRLLVMKTTNVGLNWISASTIGYNGGKVQDKPWACVDWSNSIWRNNIYVTWTEFSKYGYISPEDSSIILFSKSTNGGFNWSQPVRISKRKGDARDSCNTLEGAVPCTGPNGQIYVSWSGPITMYSNQYAIFFNKSTDGGNTWLDSERVATTQPGGWTFSIPGVMRCNGFPVTCCDLSNGPHRGNIYINFSDQRNGTNDADIWLIKSTNGGLNWSTPRRVNNDPPGKQQFFNWMAIDQVTGYLYFVFYDQRSLPDIMASVYVARSTDGGETFQNIKISTNDFLLTTSYFMGDYTNISAHNGHVRPIWTVPSGQIGIYTAIIDSFYSAINISHSPIQTSADTSARIATANISYAFGIGTGTNSPRLYYKSGNEQFSFVNAYEVNGSTYKFRIPGRPPGSKISYYLAAQDSVGLQVITYPLGGNGLNPPGTNPPQSFFTYEIYSNFNQCSNTLPKPINDLQYTLDTIQIVQNNKLINKMTVNLTIYHPNDGDLIVQLKGPNTMISLTQNNGSGGANYINTTFDDSATTSITQGTPPFTGSYKPQNSLGGFNNQPASSSWVLRVFDSHTGNTGTLVSWCILMELRNSVGIKEENIPVKYELSQNYPNPFNPTTNIKYQIANNSFVSLKIYDILGKEITTLVNENQKAGEYLAVFNTSGLASGVYFYKLVAGDFTEIKKMILIK
jgi:subtilisin-like proprotein convertase family protein